MNDAPLVRLGERARGLSDDVNDPRRRQCALGSVTSLSYAGDKVTGVHYAEPSGSTPGRVAGA